MTIQLTYHAQIRIAAACNNEALEVAPGTLLSGLFRLLDTRHTPAFRTFVVDESGRARPGIIVLINDRMAEPGADPALVDGDRIALFSPIAGG